MQIERARSMSPGKFSHDKKRPDCFLKMVCDRFTVTVYVDVVFDV